MVISKTRIADLRIPLLGLLLLAGCGELEPLNIGVCGNNVLDDGEDCDGFAHTSGTLCAAAGEANACRYVCEPACEILGADCEDYAGCPDGYGCGSDGVCRAPTGKLGATFVDLNIAPARWMRAADMDNDLQDELVMQDPAGLRLVAFDGVGDVRSEFRLPLDASGYAEIVDVDGDHARDVVVPGVDGLAVFRGGNASSLATSIYPSLGIPGVTYEYVRADLAPALPGDEGLILINQGFLHVALDNLYFIGVSHLDSVNRLVAPAVSGQLDVTSFSSEVVTAFCDAPQVDVYSFSVVGMDAETYGATTTPVMLANDELLGDCPDAEEEEERLAEERFFLFNTVAFGARIVHANPPLSGADSAHCCPDDCSAFAPGDTHADLVMAGDSGVHVAYGRGDGTFHSDVCTVATTMTPDGQTSLSPYMPAPGDHEFVNCDPLAVAHLDSDGLLDLVTPSGVWLTTLMTSSARLCDSDPFRPPVVAPVLGWRAAVVADVNADGHPDVVALNDDRGDVDVIIGSGTDAMSLTSVPATAFNREPRVGDFDGDGAQDIAMVTAASPLDVYTEGIAVLWGEPFGVPVDLETIGVVGQVVEFGVASQRPPNQFSVDTYDDIVFVAVEYPVTESGVAPNFDARFGVLSGRADRELMLPFQPNVGEFLLSDENDFVALSAHAVSAGRYAFSEDGSPGLFTVAGFTGGVPRLLTEGEYALASVSLSPSGNAGTTRGVTTPSVTGELGDLLSVPPDDTQPRFISGAVDVGDGHDQPLVFSYFDGGYGMVGAAPRFEDGVWNVAGREEVPDAAPIGTRLPADPENPAEYLKSISPLMHNEVARCRMGHPGGEHAALGVIGDYAVPVFSIGPAPIRVDDGTAVLVYAPDDVIALRSGDSPSPETLLATAGAQLGHACFDLTGDGVDELLILSAEIVLEDLDAASDFSAASPNSFFRVRIEMARYLPDEDRLSELEEVASFDGDDWPPLRNLELAAIPAQGMVAGDIDGDGVKDLIIGAYITTVVLYGEATNP